jgi:SAM-dependent methyltransferase
MTSAGSIYGEASAPYREENLFDGLTKQSTLEAHYQYLLERERRLLTGRLGVPRGVVLAVGCGWHPGRQLFPAPDYRLIAVDSNPDCVAAVAASGQADEAFVGHAGRLDLARASVDVVLYRQVLHHIAFQGPLRPCIEEAAAVLRPGGALIAIEPGLWHPVGLSLALANRLGIATAIHGTPDDVPLSPAALKAQARVAGLVPELHAVTYTWRRFPPSVQRLLHPLDEIGSRPRSAVLGHTLLMIARKVDAGAA